MHFFLILAGAIMVGISYQTHNYFSPILLVQGMIIINYGITGLFKKKSLAHL